MQTTFSDDFFAGVLRVKSTVKISECVLTRFSMVIITNDFCLFDLILYVPSTIFQLNRDRSSWVEPALS